MLLREQVVNGHSWQEKSQPWNHLRPGGRQEAISLGVIFKGGCVGALIDALALERLVSRDLFSPESLTTEKLFGSFFGALLVVLPSFSLLSLVSIILALSSLSVRSFVSTLLVLAALTLGLEMLPRLKTKRKK